MSDFRESRGEPSRIPDPRSSQGEREWIEADLDRHLVRSSKRLDPYFVQAADDSSELGGARMASSRNTYREWTGLCNIQKIWISANQAFVVSPRSPGRNGSQTGHDRQTGL